MSSFEATPSQQGIWSTERAGVARTGYHVALAVRFAGEPDLAALTRACRRVVRRHEPLRTAFDDGDGALRAVPAAAEPPVRRVPYHPALMQDEVARAFDLRRGPLARFVLAAGPDRHLLLFVAHHLVFDDLSKDVLVRDLAAGYAGAGPAPLSVSYRDFAAAERERAAADLAAARAFWRDRWREPADPVLPGLLRAPTVAESGAVHEFTLDPGLTDAVARTAEALGLTRFELFLAVLHALLYRYGNRDLPIAVDISTRTDGFDDHIGFFTNESPVPPPPVGSATFREFARRARAELREVHRFRGVPAALAVGSSRPRAATCPVSLGYRRLAAEEVKFPGLDAEVDWLVFHGSARNALHVQLVDDMTSIDVGLQYAPAAIDGHSVRRIARHLRTLLVSVVTDPDQSVVDLPVLPSAELDQVSHFGEGAPAYPPNRTVVESLAAQASATPDAVAVVAGERRLSYRELDAAAARLAGRLRARGVGAGDLVAVCLGRSPETLVAALAVGRVGAVYLPLDPEDPTDRRWLILAEAAPALLLTDGAGLAESPPVPAMALDDGSADPGRPVESVATADPERPAYVIYSVGPAGRPTGVAVSHRAVANLLRATRDAVGAGPRDRWLSLAPPSSDRSVPELFLPLLVGAATVIAPEDVVRDGAALLRLTREQGITHLPATPSVWRTLLDHGFGAAGEDRRLVALSGAESLPLPLARALRGRVARLINGYGPVEVAGWVTLAELPERVGEVTIGAPLAGTRVHLLDERGRPVPVGVPGELYVGGAQVAAGYLNRPELTAARFVPDPHGSGTLYRTGDVCRWSTDGTLVLLGRVDDAATGP